MPAVAVIGSGIAGLAAAWRLSESQSSIRVSLFEANRHFGGHANTQDLTLGGQTHGVDTGFLVFNHRTYPMLTRLFDETGVDCTPSDMSFSVQVRRASAPGLEWSGTSLDSVFAQRRNALRPRFLGMLRDVVRFNRVATALALQAHDANLTQSIGDFLDEHRFGQAFRLEYLLPMIACIWSCPAQQMLHFPIATLIRFCHNHGLIQLTDRPQWFTVRGGSRNYVRKMLMRVPDARLNTPVRSIQRLGSVVRVQTDTGHEDFDAVVLACHTDQALALLGSHATAAERQVLGSIRYQSNHAVLHTDASVLPTRRKAWAAWNYERDAQERAPSESDRVCLHYLINRLQPLPWEQPVMVSLNPLRPIDERQVRARIDYSHPVFDLGAIAAQRRLPELQGHQRVWFAGAWSGYGFHEDGLRSGLDVAESVRRTVLPMNRHDACLMA